METPEGRRGIKGIREGVREENQNGKRHETYEEKHVV
jgi:hypothetical protein